MEVSELKKEIIERINEIEDENQLVKIEIMIENLLARTRGDFWDDLPDHVKRDIEEAREEIKAGKVIPHAQAMDEIRKLFPNL
jgi:hypothetical protein